MAPIVDVPSELCSPARGPASEVIQRAYRLWAPVYDVICGRIFLSSRLAAAQAAQSNGRRILEIGVGTGLSLSDYGSTIDITGIDLSPDMIARARQRAATDCRAASCVLEVMDAHHLTFEDRDFDVVLAQFVITLVEDAERVLDECLRVTKPGGQIILVNHFQSDTQAIAWLERKMAPVVHGIGLRPDFPFERICNWMALHPGLSIIERRSSGLFGSFTIVRLRKPA